MRIQIQARSTCPAWAKTLAEKPKTPPAQHRPASGEMCKHNCGFALDSYWVYQWLDFSELQAFASGASDARQCQLCANVARPDKRLCDACSDLETTRAIEQRVEQEPEPAVVPETPRRRGGRPKKEAPPVPVVDECMICGAAQCDCSAAAAGVEDLL